MVLSRRVSRRVRITTLFYRLTWPAWRAAARRFPQGNRRENFLTIYGPASLLLLIVCWAFGLLLAFALLHAGLDPTLRTVGWAAGLRGRPLHERHDAVHAGTRRRRLARRRRENSHGPRVRDGTRPPHARDLLPAGPVTGVSAREVRISLLDARAGSPPTAMELLLRHRGDASGESLAQLLREWERWSAELLESHVSFPVLAYYRSQHDNQSWVAAMTAVLDVCAFVMASARRGADRTGPPDVRDRAARAHGHVPGLRSEAEASPGGPSSRSGASPAAGVVRG